MSENKGKTSKEWFKQADYDLDTAKAMFETGRYIYTIFMCHLSIEKALKGIYTYKLQQIPPKTHNLLYLIERIGLNVSEKLYNFIFSLNRVSIPTRYPDNLQRMLKEYNKERVEDILKKTLEALKWLKIELQKQLNF